MTAEPHGAAPSGAGDEPGPYDDELPYDQPRSRPQPAAGPTRDANGVLHFDLPDQATRPSLETTPFTIGDDPQVLYARRPKSAVLIRWAQVVESDDPAVLASVMDEFIDAVLTAESADYVRDRFEDPEDDWDYDVLVPVINALSGEWSHRPTRPPRSSSGPRRSPGRRSTARSRQRRG